MRHPWNQQPYTPKLTSVFLPEAHEIRFFDMQVPFNLESSEENNIWQSDYVSIEMKPVKATSVHSLMNCFWGTMSSSIGSIQFKFVDKTTYSVDVIVGENIRDYFQGGFTNSISATYVTEIMSPSDPSWIRLDMQTWIFPSEFQDKELCEVCVKSTGCEPTGKMFLSALTVTVREEEASAKGATSDGAAAGGGGGSEGC